MSKVDIRDFTRGQLLFEEEAARTVEVVQTGALLRIADSVEAMCENTRNLELERDQLKSQKNALGRCLQDRDRTISTLKGHITKLKKQIAALKGES